MLVTGYCAFLEEKRRQLFSVATLLASLQARNNVGGGVTKRKGVLCAFHVLMVSVRETET